MSLRLLLVQPPLTDPTCGCAALPALSAFVRANSNHTATCLDANLEAICQLLQPALVRRALRSASRELAARRQGSVADGLSSQALMARLVDLHLAGTLEADDPAHAAAILRDAGRFYDYAAYYWAASTLRKWLAALSPPQIPWLYNDFGLRDNLAEINLRNISEMLRFDVLELVVGPFSRYIDGALVASVRDGSFDVVGVTVGYHDQLPFAVRICRALRFQLPHVRLLLGGAGISQLWKYGRQTGAAQRVLAEVDAAVVGDGEPAILDILDRMESGRPLDGIPNTVWSADPQSVSGRQYVDLRDLPTPAVEDLPLAEYLAPEPLVHYAPTRGCYWNRCTFCDYGPSENSPAAPWRVRPVDEAAADLKRLGRFARFVSFSVDSISPAYLSALATRIVDEGLDIRWHAELRLDAPLNEGYFRTLRRSGCVAVSVGFESGSQRILDLIDKGTHVEQMAANIRGMADAGIGVQIMGFTGFPTETFAEATESIDLLGSLRDSWVFGGLGTLKLTAGSIIARAPERFGLQNLRFPPGDDLQCLMDYEEVSPSKSAKERAQIAELAGHLRSALQLDRPFVGGIDSPHTLMYLDRYSLSLREEIERIFCAETFGHATVTLGGVMTDWWPSKATPENERAEGTGEHYLVCDTRQVLPCSPAAADAAALLVRPRALAEVRGQIEACSDVERDGLTRGLNALITRGLVRAAPVQPPGDSPT